MLAATNNYMELVNELLRRGNGMLLAKDAVEAGISRERLSLLTKKGLLIHDGWGVYLDPDEWSDDLYSMQRRASKIIYSHVTALFLHGLSNWTPSYHSFTVPSGYRVSQSLQNGNKVYYIKPELWNLGTTTLTTGFGHDVTVYNMERTICDLLRSRHKIDVAIFKFALNSYVERKDKNLQRLMDYSRQFRVYKLAFQYMGVLL